jgi:autotransporter strand-loop-strand O-heptosyltransferase
MHDYSARNQQIQIQLPVGTLGDIIAWFPYADAFQKKHDCKLTCVISEVLKPMFSSEYQNIQFLTPDEAKEAQQHFYATYRIGLFFDDWNCVNQPVDFRYVGLHKTAAHILGVEPVEMPPKICVSAEKQKVEEPYVCIAVQSSTQCKYWNNPHGWIDIVKWLRDSGYRVLCIDKERVNGQGLHWNSIPNGAEDWTGPLPLSERASLLEGADFFVGLSSGLSWLAWAIGTPVVMISGFTHPNNEFHTPYRVFNHHTCNSCWNDPKVMFDHFDFMWCPRHKGTDRQFECTRLITVDQVKSVIKRIPGFLAQ